MPFRKIFTTGAAELGPNPGPIARDPLKLNAACAEILKYSLLRRDADAKTLGIHRLVQEVIQDGLTKEEKGQWAERAVRAANGAFPAPEFANWAQCERLVPQALACASLVEAYGFDFEAAGRLLGGGGYYLYQRGRYYEAEPLSHRALAITERAPGLEHPTVATSLNNLAALYDEQGKYAQAEPLYQRALAIWEKALGPDHPYVATGLNNLALLYKNQGKYAQAEPLYQRALTIREKVLGPDHPDVAREPQQPGAALPQSRQVRPGRTALSAGAGDCGGSPWTGSPPRSHLPQQLGSALPCQGKYGQAEPLYQRALAIPRRLWVPSTLTLPPASTTWRRSTLGKASTPRLSPSTSGRWRSGESVRT